MARFRVYIKYTDIDGSFIDEFEEITSDVVKLGSIKQSLDGSEYDIGVFRNGSCKITIRNDHARYSEVGNIRSIFKHKRSGSIIRITWDPRDHDLCVGYFYCGEEILSGEVELYKGLLDDVSSASDIRDQDIQFSVLGMESLLDRVDVPFSSISNGDNISTVVHECLNQSLITKYLTVSPSNIAVGQDEQIDDKSALENKTVKEALKELLFVSNSVLLIKDDTVYVSDRSPSASVKYTFYGQASIDGIENIIDIKGYKNGLNRTFNYWAWKDTPLLSQDVTSVSENGIRKKETSSALITDNTKRKNLLDSNRDQFSTPKTEFDLVAAIHLDRAGLFFLDKVSVDYPTVYISSDGNPVPRYGQSFYGTARYPYGQWSLTVDSADSYKIIERKIDTARHTIAYTLRKV